MVGKDVVKDKGLKCNGDSNKDYESVQSSRLMEFFLFSITNDDFIKKNNFLLVESGDFETFPWGKMVFNATLESIKDKVRSRRKMYRYGGLPLAFQCWFYECCPYTLKNLAYRIGDLVPHILNWTVKKKLVFGNIARTNVERTRLELHDFVPVYEDKNEMYIESGVVAAVNPRDDADDFNTRPKNNAKKHPKNKLKSQPINNANADPQPSNLSSSKNELKLLRISSLEQLMISSFEKIFKALGERGASKGDRKDDDHHDSHGHHDTGDIHNDYFGDKEGVVKDSIEASKSSEGVGDDEARIEDAEPEITAITQRFCDKNDVDGDNIVNIAEVKKNTANIGGLVEDSVQIVGKNSCEELGEDNGWTSDAEAQITTITQKYFDQNIVHGDCLGVEKNVANMQEDRIVVVDHDTPELIPRESKPAGVMKSPFRNSFDSGGTIQHIDVIFYYLRKKEKYGVDVPEILEKNRDMNLITDTNPIADYILGYFLRCSVPWCTVDEVLFPINLSDKWHRILARLSFKDLRIYIYDSMSGVRQNSAVQRLVEPYSVLFPYFLYRIGFWDTKENHMGIPAIDPFEIHVVDELPTQDNT
ncbi:uncharacterized protein [Nicotiana tomentosiformis]|uniref:uncharacterized protein n=1 Tax=Nicotiana tomentosiformis TaxID=4098 RepID=UPI00388C6DEA